jgi:hypothetical protein
MDAAINGDAALLLVLGQGADIDAADPDTGLNALAAAALSFTMGLQGQGRAAKLLIQHGASIEKARDLMQDKLDKLLEGKTQILDPQFQRMDESVIAQDQRTISLLKRWEDEKNPPPAPAVAAKAPAEQSSAPQGIERSGSDVDEPNYKSAPNAESFALVIGIGKYAEGPESKFAEHDAQIVKRHLLALGYPENNITTLTGAHATNSAIEDILGYWLPMNTGEKSTVFVYFSGRGAADPASKEAYLVPFDAHEDALSATAVPLSRLYDSLNKLLARHVVIALDASFSVASTSAPADGKLIVFTASSPGQTDGTLTEQKHGTFTYYFLKGLNGAAQAEHGHVSVASLYDYVAKQVAAAARDKDSPQNPQLLPAAPNKSSFEIR